MATKATTATKKDTTAPVKKSPSAKTVKAAPKEKEKKEVKATLKETEPKKAAPKPKKAVDMSKMTVKTPTQERSGAQKTATGKTAYHVSKRDNDGREWKVFIQGSDKVIKLFDTQKEALDYAKSLAKNKDDGSYVMLHGLDGKIRKY